MSGTYSQELLEPVLDAALVDGEERCCDLVDGFGQAVDVVAVACRGQQTHTKVIVFQREQEMCASCTPPTHKRNLSKLTLSPLQGSNTMIIKTLLPFTDYYLIK